MENIFFSKTIADNYNNQFLTIGDFVKICDVIKVGVFEVMIENHPKNRIFPNHCYRPSQVQTADREYLLLLQESLTLNNPLSPYSEPFSPQTAGRHPLSAPYCLYCCCPDSQSMG